MVIKAARTPEAMEALHGKLGREKSRERLEGWTLDFRVFVLI